jgi:hypothetical protein
MYVHSKQVPETHDDPNRFLQYWVESVRDKEPVCDKENVILAAAENLEGKTRTITNTAWQQQPHPLLSP